MATSAHRGDESPESLRLKKIWNQKIIPVVLRRNGKGEKLRVRIPFAKDNGAWLKNNQRLSPEWIERGAYWELPKAWFNDLVNRGMQRYGRVYIMQPFREQEICAPACQNAVGHECQCSCMGQYHGTGSDGSWFEVSDTFATRWGDREIACRLLTKK